VPRKQTLGFLLLLVGLTITLGGWTWSRGHLRSATTEAAPVDWARSVIRLHIVANSDSTQDQDLKRAVRDAILSEVTPLFAGVATPDEAERAILTASPRIVAAAGRVIHAAGRTDAVRLELGRFPFPARAYGRFFLPAGQYRALRILIGEARGANWWCVLFPPMCFLDWTTGVVLEPKPGTGGSETVTAPAQPQVRARMATVDWVRKKTSALRRPVPKSRTYGTLLQ